VFRYALERWPADTYRYVVFHEGPLSDQDKSLVDQLERFERIGQGRPPLQGVTVDVTEDIPELLAPLWHERGDQALPMLLLLPPAPEPSNQVVWRAPLDQASVQSMLDSPVRREIVRRLTSGHTAVWLLLLSGDAEMDARVKADLQAQLEAMPNDLQLPHELDGDDTLYDTPMSDVELKIEFSMIPLNLNDPNEVVLTTLVREAMLDSLDQYLPAAIPVFGKGRALVVLDKSSLVPEVVTDVCRFLVGPCACQVNQQNPGVDLLMPVDWDGLITGMIGMEETPALMVPLAGNDEISQEVNIVDVPEADPLWPVATSGHLKRNLGIMAILGAAALMAATWLLKKDSPR
jgi:hypothetical protein